jgi:protein-S-isoprenylcysteine O-methyltransferase Ste14
MTTETATRILVPLLLAAFAFADLVWPLLRLRRIAGTYGLAILAERDPRGRGVGLALLLIVLALVAGIARFAAGGAAAIGATVPPAPVAGVGLALLAAAVAIVAIAQRQMGASLRLGIPNEDTALVSAGLFRWVRNPIFLGMLLGFAGVAIAVPSAWSVAVWLGATATIAYQVRLEEEHLLERHGDAYRAYASRVGRFFPGVGRLDA